MKNKKIISVIIAFILLICNSTSYAANEFNFDVTNIEIIENGKIFKGFMFELPHLFNRGWNGRR